MRKLLAVIGFLVLLIGCGGDDAGSGGNSGGVTIIGGESLTFGSSVTSHEIQLSGSVSWSAKSDDNCKNWCYPFKASGNSDKIVLNRKFPCRNPPLRAISILMTIICQ